MLLFAMIGKMHSLWNRFINRCNTEYLLTNFHEHGKGGYISQNCTFTPNSISIGDNVYFGIGCVIVSAHGRIKIGDNVMFGPGVHVHGGNHVIDRIGCYMNQVKKEIGCDPDVVIEDDVWLGANSIVLEGVHIGRGAVIGAGTVVTKNIDPYAICVGNPCREVRKRFSDEDIVEHERILALKKQND